MTLKKKQALSSWGEIEREEAAKVMACIEKENKYEK